MVEQCYWHYNASSFWNSDSIDDCCFIAVSIGSKIHETKVDNVTKYVMAAHTLANHDIDL